MKNSVEFYIKLGSWIEDYLQFYNPQTFKIFTDYIVVQFHTLIYYIPIINDWQEISKPVFP